MNGRAAAHFGLKALLLLAFLVLNQPRQCLGATPLSFPLQAKRIVFLGDSITHAGHYVAWIESQLRLQSVDPLPEIVNVGLGSETCSGLSEPDHPFPRPDVHERLDRALEKLKPDVVVACYGMNDGIYHPFSDERFQAYQDGVNRLIKKVHAVGAKLVLMTPPPFDAVPLRESGKLKPDGEKQYAYFAMYENYDDVLARYGKWIMQQKGRVDMVVDLHTPFVEYLAQKRKTEPNFTLSPDGIHPNMEGHRLIGNTILNSWGIESQATVEDELLTLVTRRLALLHDAWLSDIGHKHPSVKAGLPTDQASAQAAEIEAQITPLVEKAKQPTSAERPATGGTVFEVHYPAVAQPDQLRIAADYYLWIPEGVSRLRGVIVHQHGCGRGASLGGSTAADDLHWQALAKKWNCALMGSQYEPRDGINCRLWCDARNGSEKRFLQALTHLASASSHPELETIPWCLWGHSGGGFWASLMQTKYPERIVAIWFRSGTAFGAWSKGDIETPEIPDAAFQVPVLGNPGLKEKDHKQFRSAYDGLLAMQTAYREKGAIFEFAPDPRTAHECGDSRYFAIPYFDFWLENRLAPAGSAEQTLRPAKEAIETWRAKMAPMMAEYVETGAVSDTSPPPAPQSVSAKRNPDGSVTIAWQATADFESGIRGFVVERGGEKLTQVPEKPVGRFGRPLFQTMSYHDTPESPLPAMRYVDLAAPQGELPTYRVRTVNSVGLESEPTASQN